MTALVGISLPFALVGGVVAVLLSGGVMSLGSLVGFVTVLGISARNGIMLISHYRHLEDKEGEACGPEPAAARRGRATGADPDDRLLRGAGAAAAGRPRRCPRHEIEHPMALVILGGLVSSTVLNLLLMPSLYGRFGRENRKPRGEEGMAIKGKVVPA